MHFAIINIVVAALYACDTSYVLLFCWTGGGQWKSRARERAAARSHRRDVVKQIEDEIDLEESKDETEAELSRSRKITRLGFVPKKHRSGLDLSFCPVLFAGGIGKLSLQR